MILNLTETQIELICDSLLRSQGAYEALAVHAHNRNNIEQFKSLARDCAALLNDIHTHSYRSSDSA